MWCARRTFGATLTLREEVQTNVLDSMSLLSSLLIDSMFFQLIGFTDWRGWSRRLGIRISRLLLYFQKVFFFVDIRVCFFPRLQA